MKKEQERNMKVLNSKFMEERNDKYEKMIIFIIWELEIKRKCFLKIVKINKDCNVQCWFFILMWESSFYILVVGVKIDKVFLVGYLGNSY